MLVTTQMYPWKENKNHMKDKLREQQGVTFIFPQQMELHQSKESVFSDLITKQDVSWKMKS